MRLVLAWFLAVFCLSAQPQPLRTREMNDLNWAEFRRLVPSRIETVLLPTGTVEAHGVINNGADNTAPLALARAMAPRVNALVAPLVPYGVTGSLDGYPGTFQVSAEVYKPFVTEVMRGLAKQGFRNIIVVNGHGGPQSAILSDIAEAVGRDQRVRTMVTNWWAICSDVTMKVFGEDGGHAGWNETAFIQAIDSSLIRKEMDPKAFELARQASGTWTAFPYPAPIILYQEGQGSVRFDDVKAKEYFAAVVEKMSALVIDTVQRWDRTGAFR